MPFDSVEAAQKITVGKTFLHIRPVETNNSMSEFSKTACSRCREQKVKCGKELPKCARCSRVEADCIFPEPPDRKLLATYRSSYGTHTKRRKTKEGSCGEPSTAPPSSFTALLSAAEGASALDFQEGSCADINNGLSRTQRQFLIDVYFTHMYNAWLLFHRPTLLENIDAGLVLPHVLVSIYATATVFLPAGSPLARSNASLLHSLGDLKILGQKWATQAGREALPEVVDPTIQSIQTCQVLALFWFSIGHSRTNTMYSGVAYKAACVFGLGNPPRPNAPTEAPMPWVEQELRRRIFWATWLTNCINSEHYTVGTSVNDDILNFPLPADDLSFRNSVEVPPVTTRDALEQQKTQVSDRSRAPPSIMAELVKLMMIWAAIGDYLEARKHQSGRDSLIALFDLDGRLADWSLSLHPIFSYSKRNLYKQLVVEQQPAYIFVHALHHQSCLVLHSSLVPQFSGLAVDNKISVEAVNVSARAAHKHAQAISDLGSDLVALDWEFSRIAPFVGYCMYVSASIHIVFLFSQNSALAVLAKSRLVSNLKVLSNLKAYWSNLERLWARIHILYEAQTSPNQQAITTGDRTSTEVDALETLAQQRRDTGRLEEPLATSVLEYSLRLKPTLNTKINQDTINDIERKIYNDPLARIADRDNARLRPQQIVTVPIPQEIVAAGSATYMPSPSSTTSNSVIAGQDSVQVFGGDQTLSSVLALPYFMQEGGDDWWQSDLDTLTQAMRGHNDLFEIGH